MALDFEKGDRGRDGYVERFDRGLEWDGDLDIGPTMYFRGQASTFGAQS